MAFDNDEAVPIPLSRRPYGIETFRVEGCLDAEFVHANWDGRWVIASRLLSERAAIAMAVDDAFAESGIAPSLTDAQLERSPEQLMLTLLTCCDEIDVAEYEVCGYRRVIAPNV